MDDHQKTKNQLIEELTLLRQQLPEGNRDRNLPPLPPDDPDNLFYKHILDNIDEGILLMDRVGKIFFVNNAMARIAGVSKERILGAMVLTDFAEDTLRQFTPHYLKAQETLHTVSYDSIAVVTPAGRMTYQTGILVPIVKDGRFDGMLCTIHDITERIRSKEALEKVNKLQSVILNNSTVGIALVRNRVFEWVNPQMAALFGIPQEQLQGASTRIIYPSDEDYDRLGRDAYPLLAQGQKAKFQIEMRKADGSSFWCRLEGNALDGSHPDQGSIWIWEDVTERKQVEKTLYESEELYRTALEGSNDGVAIIQHGRYVYVNERFLAKLGRDREEIIGRAMGSFFHPDDRAEYFDFFSKYQQGLAASNHFETRACLPDGAIIHVDVSLVEVVYKGDKAVLIYTRDITDRKRVEAERMKVHKLESVGTLAAGIAHDFNNLLLVIQGYLDLLKMETPPGDKIHNRLMAAQKAISQATELTSRLITFAKGGEPIKKVVDIGHIVRDAVLHSVDTSAIEKDFRLNRDVWPVHVDERQIYQVVRNLTINAVEAMPEGGRLTISAENARVKTPDGLPIREGEYVRISLEDTGRGIPANEKPLIFDPYYSTKQRGANKGMGLGLSVCHSVVNKHNGCITFESQEGRGSTFCVYLPAAVGEDRTNAGSNQGSGAKERILVMDDEAMVREMLTELLMAMGYDVETANDGLAAIDLYAKAEASQRPYKLVILDLMVPGGMGGKPTMERLLAINPEVKGIILTGYTNDSVIQDFTQYGFAGALKKPFRYKALQDMIEKYL